METTCLETREANANVARSHHMQARSGLSRRYVTASALLEVIVAAVSGMIPVVTCFQLWPHQISSVIGCASHSHARDFCRSLAVALERRIVFVDGGVGVRVVRHRNCPREATGRRRHIQPRSPPQAFIQIGVHNRLQRTTLDSQTKQPNYTFKICKKTLR